MLNVGEAKLIDTLQIDMLAGEPQVVGILHGEPAFRAASNCLGKAKCHFRRDTRRVVEYPAECGSSYAERFGKFTPTDIVGLKVDVGYEFTRMGWCMHAH